MAHRESKFEDFFKTLKQVPQVNEVEKFGLQETSILNINNNLNNSYKIYEFFVFSTEGIIVLNNKFNSATYMRNEDTEKNFHNQIKKMVKQFYNLSQVKPNTQLNYSKSKVTSFNSINNFSFQKIFYGNYKIVFLIKDGLILSAVCQDNVKGYYIKLYLLHMYVSFINFNGTLIDSIKNMQSEAEVDYSQNEFFQLKIYELYFIKHLTNHFERIFKFLIKKEEMYLSYIKFKNMYVVDLLSGEILFDMLALRKSKKNQKIFRNEKLWQELLHHSKYLMETYKQEHNNKYEGKDSFYRFVKFECTSTYPRLTFIIKFLPVLNGISIIHVYSQKKLSRMSENNDQHMINKGYKEIDLLYGAEVKNNNNIEFRYTEPKKLQEIEKFFIEFYISIRVNYDIFHDADHELKYFDYSVITTISEILISRKEQLEEGDASPSSKIHSIDSIISKINSKLYEEYLNTCVKLNGADRVDKNDKRNSKFNKVNAIKEEEIERDSNNTSLFLIIKKDLILQELFENNSAQYQNTSEINLSDNKLNSSSNDFLTGLKASAKFYMDHGDGWTVNEGGNLVVDNLGNNKNNNHSPASTKKSLKRAISNIPNNNVTINLSKIENEIGAGTQKADESGLQLGQLAYFTLHPEETNPNQTNININNNDDNTMLTIDYLMNELDNNKVNKNTNTSKSFITNGEIDKSIPDEKTPLELKLSTKNVFETLIKNKKTLKSGDINNNKVILNGSSVNSNKSNLGCLNLNIPLSNIFSQKMSPNKKNNFYRKETNPQILNNRLTLYDGPNTSENNNQYRNFQKLKTGHAFARGNINFEGIYRGAYGSNFDNNEMNREDESSIEHVKQIQYIHVVENNQHNNGIHPSSNEMRLGTGDKLIDEADNEQSPEYKESSISSGMKGNK